MIIMIIITEVRIMNSNKTSVMVILLVVSGYLLSGINVLAVSEQTTPSNVTVSAYVAIALSTNWTAIEFGNVNPGTNDNNASHNYDGGNVSNANTTYWVTVSTDSNLNADLCIKDNWALNTTGGNVIGNTNYTYSNNTNDTVLPLPGTAVTTSHVQAGYSVAPGGKDYFRFWLDIPTAQAAGTYNNTVYIKGVSTGSSC